MITVKSANLIVFRSVLDPFLPSISTATVFLEPEELYMLTKITLNINLVNEITYYLIAMHNRGRH
jgi:hypothetical protein